MALHIDKQNESNAQAHKASTIGQRTSIQAKRISAKEARHSLFFGGAKHPIYDMTNISQISRHLWVSVHKEQTPETGFTPDIYEMLVIHLVATDAIFMNFGILLLYTDVYMRFWGN